MLITLFAADRQWMGTLGWDEERGAQVFKVPEDNDELHSIVATWREEGIPIISEKTVMTNGHPTRIVGRKYQPLQHPDAPYAILGWCAEQNRFGICTEEKDRGAFEELLTLSLTKEERFLLIEAFSHASKMTQESHKSLA